MVDGNKEVERFKEFRLAQQFGKLIVSPLWLQKVQAVYSQCLENGTRLPEEDFPHTINPAKSLLIKKIDHTTEQQPPANIKLANIDFSRAKENVNPVVKSIEKLISGKSGEAAFTTEPANGTLVQVCAS